MPPAAQATLLARFEATRAAKAQWRKEGKKISDLSGSDIRLLANEWLIVHPELIAEARSIVAGWIEDRAKLSIDLVRGFLCKCYRQNGAKNDRRLCACLHRWPDARCPTIGA
jgi:hypothetical protein